MFTNWTVPSRNTTTRSDEKRDIYTTVLTNDEANSTAIGYFVARSRSRLEDRPPVDFVLRACGACSTGGDENRPTRSMVMRVGLAKNRIVKHLPTKTPRS